MNFREYWAEQVRNTLSNLESDFGFKLPGLYEALDESMRIGADYEGLIKLYTHIVSELKSNNIPNADDLAIKIMQYLDHRDGDRLNRKTLNFINNKDNKDMITNFEDECDDIFVERDIMLPNVEKYSVHRKRL